MSNFKCCSKHQEYRAFNRIHYGNCLYCLLDKPVWSEEWDSWDQVAVRAGKITQMGFLDAKNGNVYKWKESAKKGKIVRDGIRIRQLYMAGVQMWNDELAEWPKDKNEIFPEGFDQTKYDKIVNVLKDYFELEEISGKGYVDIDTLKIVYNPLPENVVKYDFICSSSLSKKVLKRISEMIENEGLY